MTTTFKIKGIAAALPEHKITNEELITRYSHHDVGSFLKITGIEERRSIGPGQSASDLAHLAADKLLNELKIDRTQIDTLSYCSLTEDYRTPATACILQDRLGLSKNVCTFDLVQACPAFIHHLAVIQGLITSGTSKSVLAIHADSLSQLIHPKDRGLVPIHGDGALVMLLEKEEAAYPTIEWFSFGTDGAQAERIVLSGGMSRNPFTEEMLQEKTDENGNIHTPLHLKMDGAAVFHFAIHTVPPFLKKSCEDHGTSLEDYDLVLFHQANKMIVEMLYSMLKIPMNKRFYYLKEVGNLSGVSLPFTLGEAVRAGLLKPGMRVLLCGFGAGLSWGAASIRWQEDADIVVPPCSILPEPTR